VPLDGSTVRIDPDARTARTDDEADAQDKVHCLAVVEGLDAGRKIVLAARALTVGRMPPADIVLPDPQVSRSHCQLRTDGHRVIVTDLGSTNGTFVHGQRVTEQAELAIGAELRIGKHLFRHEFRSRRRLEAEQAEWERQIALRQEASQIHIEIDQAKRQQEVESITKSDFFQTLTQELEQLRPK
jgi:pSer/pThr/pTyr-binding forkhead associated (FHA) protein